MPDINVYDKQGEKISVLSLKDEIFGVEIKQHLVHMVVVQYLANQRQGTKSTKTRAEVRGGGRKPWRQKGTGRARQGSIRSPQWVGGGVVFAPKPRDFSFKVNKKIKKLALKSVLTSKFIENKIVIVEDLDVPNIKTKEILTIFSNLKVENALVVLGDNENNAYLSLKNVKNINTARVNTINSYNILLNDKFVVTRSSMEKIQEVYI